MQSGAYLIGTMFAGDIRVRCSPYIQRLSYLYSQRFQRTACISTASQPLQEMRRALPFWPVDLQIEI